MRQPGRAVVALPAVVDRAGGGDPVRDIFLQFERHAQRQRSILRLILVGVMTLAVWSSAPPSRWPTGFALIAGYGILAITAAWVWIGMPCWRSTCARSPRPSLTSA